MYRWKWPAFALGALLTGACEQWLEQEKPAPSAQAPAADLPVAKAPPPAPPVQPVEPIPPPPPPPLTTLSAPLMAAVTQGDEAPSTVEGEPSAVEGEPSAALGKVQLHAASASVRVHVQASGLPPGPKAVHIHAIADCSDLEGGSAGGHFAPEGQHHGLPDAANHHRGDLGNLLVKKNGAGTLDIEVKRVSLKRGEPASMVNRALVVRSKPEDGLGLARNQGEPLACAELVDPYATSEP